MISDPDYARIYTIGRCIAQAYGYALALHGSTTRDLDLVAIPWTEHAADADHFVCSFANRAGLRSIDAVGGAKPHGRRAWTLMLADLADPRYIDLSIMPRVDPWNGDAA